MPASSQSIPPCIFPSSALRVAVLAEDLPAVGAVREDPSDNAVRACAIATHADVIVSGDRHLLVLRAFRGIPIVRAAMLLPPEKARPS